MPTTGLAGAGPIDALDPGHVARLLRKLFLGARGRAGRSGIPFALEPAHVAGLWSRQEGRCAISGIRFGYQRFDHAFVKHPYAPSLDRIDARGGYTPDNVRLVCTCVNFGMGQWGEEVLRRVAEGLLAKEREVPRPGGAEEQAWLRRQRAKLAAAEHLARDLSGDELRAQRRRIAALKRNLTLGPEGLRRTARRAHERRRAGLRVHVPDERADATE